MSERLKNFVWIIVVIVAFSIFSLLRGGTSIYLNFDEDSLFITAPENYTHKVAYDEIIHFELIDKFDPGTLISGGENRKYQWGTWKNDTWGEYALCASKQIDNALILSLSNGELLVLNYESKQFTAALPEFFNSMIEKQ